MDPFVIFLPICRTLHYDADVTYHTCTYFTIGKGEKLRTSKPRIKLINDKASHRNGREENKCPSMYSLAFC
jgi:hypothetical protein